MKALNFCILLCSLLFSYYSAANEQCSVLAYHSQAQVDKVVDGDTVKLTSGQLVRLIGIDTPEINHKNKTKSEPLALQAKQYLTELIGKNKKINLVLDNELVDSYNRMLAHVFNHKDENVQQKLVNKGYADAWVYGSNSLFWQCYRQAELSARVNKLGIWQYPKWQPKRAKTVAKSQAYQHEWVGQLNRVFNKDQVLWFVLDERLYVGIRQQDLYQSFKTIDFTRLIGQDIHIQASVFYKDKHWRAYLSKPWQLTLGTQLN
ncbi:thermonuclease family protein [Catenovulum adriaticum]|uniref:Thermonuclease family protein n=1 Tax=Catenovulum adriaticum TaxID=2984846 RepID=A0ABY7ANY1_9ALTE|nr:thermonuclease family protein [Catenovulum sp. TS8]WAJ70851.1 thermonuclease family protein [Catenovulum sp. TS8]